MDPMPPTPEPSQGNSPALSDKDNDYNDIPPEQVEIIRSIVDKWHKKPLQIANDIVSALETGDHTHIPLIVRNGENQEVVIWAKCDTGACANFITMSLVRKLKLEYDLISISDLEETDNPSSPTSPRDDMGIGILKKVCGFENRQVSINYNLLLTFQTGKYRNEHKQVEFSVLEIGDGVTSPAANEMTDLFLGASWLFRNEVFMLRKSYYVDPPRDLPVIETVPLVDLELTPIARPSSGVRYGSGVPSVKLRPGPAPPLLPRGGMVRR